MIAGNHVEHDVGAMTHQSNGRVQFMRCPICKAPNVALFGLSRMIIEFIEFKKYTEFIEFKLWRLWRNYARYSRWGDIFTISGDYLSCEIFFKISKLFQNSGLWLGNCIIVAEQVIRDDFAKEIRLTRHLLASYLQIGWLMATGRYIPCSHIRHRS